METSTTRISRKRRWQLAGAAAMAAAAALGIAACGDSTSGIKTVKSSNSKPLATPESRAPFTVTVTDDQTYTETVTVKQVETQVSTATSISPVAGSTTTITSVTPSVVTSVVTSAVTAPPTTVTVTKFCQLGQPTC